MPQKKLEWWEDFFPAFRPVFSMIPPRESNAQVRYLIKKLHLKPGRKFLDCPCGIGRLSLPLVKKGIRVTGVDITRSYLDEISATCKRRKLKIKLVKSDMRRINFDSEFDAAGNLWTSFGYFKKESDNLLVLKKMYKSLKPGGRFILSLINRDWIMVNFAPTGWRDINGMKILEERSFDYEKSMNYAKWIYIKDGVEKKIESAIRLYSFHELVVMLKSVGFTDISGFGSMKDEPIDRTKNMMFVFGSKPKRR